MELHLPEQHSAYGRSYPGVKTAEVWICSVPDLLSTQVALLVAVLLAMLRSPMGYGRLAPCFCIPCTAEGDGSALGSLQVGGWLLWNL